MDLMRLLLSHQLFVLSVLRSPDDVLMRSTKQLL
jgi:hypothetical protein